MHIYIYIYIYIYKAVERLMCQGVVECKVLGGCKTATPN